MAEDKNWYQRSLEQAAERKLDYEHGHRTGSAFNNESLRGATTRDAERRDRATFEAHSRSAGNSISGGYLPQTGSSNRTSTPKGEPSTGESIAAWLNGLPDRVSSGARWTIGIFIALAGYGASVSQGVEAGTAAILAILLVAVLAVAVKAGLFLLGLAVVLTELAIKVAVVVAILYFGYLWLRSSGVL